MQRKPALFILPLLLLLLLAQPVLARSYHFLDLEIDARLGADGIVRVTETHTVQFNGRYTGMYQWIDLDRGLEVRDVVVSENSVPYTRLERDSPGPTGTYFVTTKDGQLYIDWSFEAEDEIRIFQLSYVLDNVVLKHNDVGEFYYQFVGDQWEKPRDHVRITLWLPYGAQQDEILAWGHGPRQGVVTIASPQEIVWEVDDLPSRTFVEGRVVFPTRLVPLAERTTNKDGLAGIVAEEEGKIERRERRERLKKFDPYAALIVVAVFYLLNAYIYYNYAKPHPGFKDKYYKELPAKYPPAVLGVLWQRPIDGQTFMATVLDLARRGYLQIEETPEAGRRKDEADYAFIRRERSESAGDKLSGYEQKLLSFLFERTERDRISLTEIEEYVRDEKKDFREFWQEWSKEIDAEGKKYQFFEGNKRVYWFLVPGTLLFIGCGIPFSLDMFLTGIACLIMGLVTFFMAAFGAERRTPQGQAQYTKWRALRRYLKDFSRVDTSRIGSLGIWEEYVPYAYILGVGDQLLNQLNLVFPDLRDGAYNFGSGWFIYYHTFSSSRFTRFTNSFESSLTQSIATTGTGGGFTGGGGGGFGGGGGGAR